MRFDRTNKWMVMAEGFIAVVILSVFACWTTWEVSFPLFFSIVIALVSYHGGMFVGTIIAIASLIGWEVTDILTHIPYTRWYAPYWNIGVRFGTFLLIAYMMAHVRKVSDLNDQLARTDPLTGVWNRRHFYELVGVEMHRASRYKHAFTMIYLDLDDFKAVNDTLGHLAGDDLLRVFARTIRTNLRATDCIARLGGDEFAILLSQTNQESAASYLDKMRRQLVEAMRDNGWNITFSVGAMTYLEPPSSIDDMIRQADTFMYSAKRDGKDKIKHEVVCNSEPV